MRALLLGKYAYPRARAGSCCECAPIQERACAPKEREIECGGRRREMGRGVERGKEGERGGKRERKGGGKE